jgi:hypothetical protein
MHKEEDLTPAERELECALGRLTPTANTLSRDGLMFNAGRAAAGKNRPWQMFSGVLMVLLLCSVLIRFDVHEPLESSPAGEPRQYRMAQSVYRPVQTQSSAQLAYPTLRKNIVQHGLDALPLEQGAGNGAQQKSRKQWLHSMLSS